jgi:predicted nucleic acid-binding Zn ribbon protein
MDIADRAQQLEEAARQAALTYRQRIDAPVAGDGVCLNCEEPLADGQRFCDQSCRDDFARLQAKAENDRILRGLGS